MEGMQRNRFAKRGSAPNIDLTGLQIPMPQKKEIEKKKSKDDEIKEQRFQKALSRIKKNQRNPGKNKRFSQPNILNNPKYAEFIKEMGDKYPGAPMQKKESIEEVKAEDEKEIKDDIIMSKPVINKNNAKKKPKKIDFDKDAVNEKNDKNEDKEEINEDDKNQNN